MSSSPPPLAGVIFDWAGTTVDHGCMAPVAALQDVLARHGLPVTAVAARRGMGLPKKEHLRGLLREHHREAETDALYPELEKAILTGLERHSTVIPGVTAVTEWLRARRVPIGSTTGYTEAMMEIVAVAAAHGGYEPDAVVTPDGLPGGRPAPYMIYANALRLGLWPLWRCVKVGDTPSDIAEGRNAGCWTIGVAVTGNAVGLTIAELAALPADQRLARCAAARHELWDAGADYVADSAADIVPVLEEIAGRLQAGERPGRVAA